MGHTISQRKTDHLTLCATGDVAFHGASTLFEEVRLVHDALPELAFDAIDPSLQLFGKPLRAPLVIAAMTGGTDEAGRVNQLLAAVAEERGYAFGLGSQRAMHLRPGSRATYRVRQQAPSTVVFGNLGLVQARDMSTPEIRGLVDEVGADALCVHLNPAMELVQPGGDRDFSRGAETLARLVEDLGVPVIVKETGCGLSPGVGRRLRRLGIRHVDTSGAGGTSWVGVETRRAEESGDAASATLGHALWDWGVPTAASVALLAPLGFETLIATGGVGSGLDVAKAVALGASCAGIARPVLRALYAAGADEAAQRQAVLSYLDGVESELRAAMLLTGSADLAALRRAPRVVGPTLERWTTQLSSSPGEAS